MTPEMVMNLAYQGMKVTIYLASPVLLVTLAVGLTISLLQAATQINEMTLSFIPKVASVLAVLVICGHWMIGMLVSFTKELLINIPSYVG